MNLIDIFIIVVLIVWFIIAFRSYKKQKNGCSGNCLQCLLKGDELKQQFRQEKGEDEHG